MLDIVQGMYRKGTMTTEDVDSVQSTHHRQRLRPWIVEQIHSGKYKGLEWTNDQKTEFKIPWKHAAKNDYDQEEDSKIFKVGPISGGSFSSTISEYLW
ncbi:interferon regulatory factor 8-like [Saccoglossus kowalevskii]